jgi:hypothetical protein
LRISAVALADAGSLAWLQPHVSVVGHVTHLRAWVAQVGADRAVVEVCLAAMWLLAVWVAVGITAGVAAALPGAAGRLGAAAMRIVLPRALYRIVAGAAGLGVLVTPGLAAASAAPSAPPSASTPTPTPEWPTDSSRSSAGSAAAPREARSGAAPRRDADSCRAGGRHVVGHRR